MTLRYLLQVDPEREPYARYAMDLLLDGAGIDGEPAGEAASADLVYAAERPTGDAFWIRADRVEDWNAPTAGAARCDGIPVLYQKGKPDGLAGADLLYSTYAMATGALEASQERNPWGVPLAENSFLLNEGLLQVPAVSAYANLLAERLSDRFPQRSRWPEGKRYAVVLSHDVDTPFTDPPRGFLWTMMLRHLGRADLGTAEIYAKAWTKQVLGIIPPPGRDDPNFRFDDWLREEEKLGCPSCFYVAVRRSTEKGAAEQDVFYDHRHPDMIDALKRVTDAGWEVGLHASVHAWRRPGWFREERERLQDAIPGYRVAGLRHHYWAMDPHRPEETLALHAEAGFEYDSSLGLNDAPGFRRGLAWPFRPFHRDRREVLPILEVPPTLMDGGIFYHDMPAEEAAERLRAHFRTAFRHGGAAVLDWHLEQLNPALLQGAGPLLIEILQELRDDGDIWWTSPGRMAAWWRSRSDPADRDLRDGTSAGSSVPGRG